MACRPQGTPPRASDEDPGLCRATCSPARSLALRQDQPRSPRSAGHMRRIQMLTATVGLGDPEGKAAEWPLIPKVILTRVISASPSSR